MTCIDCTQSAQRLWHRFQASCKGCQARAIARGPHFSEARRTGWQTASYQALLGQFALTHAEVKAAHSADALSGVV